MERFVKGYQEDAGVDIILDEDVVFAPLSTTSVNLRVKLTPEENTMMLLFARTSAAKQGLVVNSCPVDPNYSGDVYAIVSNVSNKEVIFKKGEAFCQYVHVPIICERNLAYRKDGKRSNGNFGSTGK